MKYQSSNSRLIYTIDFEKKRNICPECSENRKKKKNRDLEFFRDTNTAYCFHCNTTFFEYKKNEKQYKIPELKNITKLTDKAVKWFTSRMISQNTLNEMKIYSDVEYMPQFEKEIEVICFPYFRGEQLVNIKYRGAKKSFKLHSGSELIWYNYDALDNSEVIICEGEIDLLTYIENGYKNIISVPNGAGNIEYLDNTIELFDSVEKVILSTDVDTKGIKLRDELIRRIGEDKCYIVSFRECKDANEYFIKHGGLEFKDRVNAAELLKIKGIISIDDIDDRIDNLYENGLPEGLSIGHYSIDEHIRWQTKQVSIFTGIPSSGKSEFVDYIVSKLNVRYNWKAAYFSPENHPLEMHYAKLHEKISGKKFKAGFGDDDYENVKTHLNGNISYLLDENDMTLQKVLTSAKYCVKKAGIKVLVLDPYNMFEHKAEKNENETQYISRFLDELKKFAKFNDILVILVAHPAKLMQGQVPNLYSISGSANFYNKADYGITVHRKKDENGAMNSLVEIHVQKVRFKNFGKQGVIELKYNYNNGRYEDSDVLPVNYDNECWLKAIKEPDFWDNIKENNEIPF